MAYMRGTPSFNEEKNSIIALDSVLLEAETPENQ
jgi:hypothetical protein